MADAPWDRSATRKPDFGNVRAAPARAGNRQEAARPVGTSVGWAKPSNSTRPDFSGVRTTVSSTEDSRDPRMTAPPARTVTVVRGDTLSHIARRAYGRASAWRAVYEANRDILDDPDRLYPGQVLRLPDLDD